MVKLNCIYHSFENDGNGVYSQCEFHTKGICPCETCNSFISEEQMECCIEILKRVRKDLNL